MTQKKLTVPFLTLRPGEYASTSDESTAIIRYNSVLNRIEVSLDTGPYLPIGSGGGDGYFFDQLVAAPQVAPLLDGYLAYVDGYSTELNKVSVDDLLALGIGGGVASVGASAPLSSTGGTNPVIGFSSWPSNSAGALTNDGLGNLSWDPSGSSATPGGPVDSLQINDGYGGFIGYSDLVWDNSLSTLGLVGGISQSAGAVSLAANAASSVTTSAGALTLTSADAATWSTTTGNLAITGGSSLQLAAGAGEVVVNDGGLASNFRVESDTDPNMLFVDGTNNRIGIGTSAPSSTFSVGSTSQFRVSSTGDLERIRDVAYSFPDSQGAAGTVLTNDGSGVLSWVASTAGATSAPISTKTSSYVMTTADGTILADATSGAITITLPAAASATETIFTIKKKDVTSNIVTVDANGAELIDGSTTYDLSTQYEAIKIQSDGSAWWII